MINRLLPKPHVITTTEIFVKLDVDKVKGKGNIKRIYKCSDKKALSRKIFLRYLHVLMTAMCEGGRTFVFPSRIHMELRWRVMRDSTFRINRSLGRMIDIDIIASERKNYELILFHRSFGRVFITPVRLSQNFKDRVAEKINSGYKYC